MVTENGMVMMTLGEYHSLNATKNKVKEIEKSNETEIYCPFNRTQHMI